MTGSTAPFIVIDTDILSERNLIEQDFHILDRIDGHSGLADIADYALVDRNHIPGVLRDRTRPKDLSVPRPDSGDKKRSTLRRSRSRHIGESSTAALRTSWNMARAGREEVRRRSQGAQSILREAPDDVARTESC